MRNKLWSKSYNKKIIIGLGRVPTFFLPLFTRCWTQKLLNDPEWHFLQLTAVPSCERFDAHQQHSHWHTRLLELASPIETVAKDLAHAFAFIAPPCKLLLLQGSLKWLNSWIAPFMHVKGRSHKVPNLMFLRCLRQTYRAYTKRVGKKIYINLISTKAVARAKYVSSRSKFSGDLAHENGQFSCSLLSSCFSRFHTCPILSDDIWSSDAVWMPINHKETTTTNNIKS